jgi:hypothetical protein
MGGEADVDDAIAAAFGTERFEFSRDAKGGWIGRGNRDRDGVVRPAPQPQGTRLSAVIVVFGLGVSTLITAEPWLFHNPLASFPVNPEFWPGHQLLPSDDGMEFQPRAGSSIGDVLRKDLVMRSNS